ncbi:MAG: hypothetical protein GY705_08785, partial [Bacteroidetes bacterium]|nr:hypothetical protein [Bacteroidota bacterium]
MSIREKSQISFRAFIKTVSTLYGHIPLFYIQYTFIISLLIFLSANAVNGQNADELLRQSNLLKRTGQRDAGLKILDDLFLESQAKKKHELGAEVLSTKANYFAYYSHYDTAAILAKEALKYAEKHKVKQLLPKLLLQNGRLAMRNFDYDQIIEYCSNALDLATKYDQKTIILSCDACLKDAVNIYYYETTGEDHLKPAQYAYKKAIDALKATIDTATYLSYMLRYTDLYRSTGDIDSLQMLIDEMESTLEVYVDYKTEASLYIMKSIHSALIEDTDGEYANIRKALKISHTINIPELTQHYYLRLYWHFKNDMQQYDEAQNMLDSAAAIRTNYEEFDGPFYYYEIYKAKGETALALKNIEAWQAIKDEKVSKDRMAYITEWEIKHKTKEKEAELAKQQNQRNLFGLIAIFIALLGL